MNPIRDAFFQQKIDHILFKNISTMAKTSKADNYEHLSDLEHALKRPDTYIGSVQFTEEVVDIIDMETMKIFPKKISISYGLQRIYEEVLLNAFDHQVRADTGCTEIRVDINETSVSVMNNGSGIPIVMKQELNMYVPTMIFGLLRSGSNYKDNQKRLTGGKNGLGAKLTNIFSKKFTVETIDADEKLSFTQTWSNNMSERSDPIIKKSSKKPFTTITFEPDFAYFGIEKYSDDMIALMGKRLVDIGYATKSSVKTYLNGTLISIKKPMDYINLYDIPEGYKPIVDETNERWSVGLCYSNDGFKQVSFVNGIHTTEGGSHVDHVINLITKEIIDKLKSKKIEVKPSDLKNKMFLFVKCAIEEPDFKSQTKEHMKMPVSKFGSSFVPSEAFKKKLHTCDILKSMLEVSEKAKLKTLSKTNGKKLNRIVGIDTLEDAAWAGTSKALQTKLILTEGLSAKTFAMRARSVIGYDRFGIFPLKGKMLNVRNVNLTRVSANEEIKNLVRILGLNYDIDYKNVNDMASLRYGGIIALADADHDGNHICGLIINYIHTFWPTLIEKGFVNMIATPIVKVFKSKETLSFYTMNDYENWAETARGNFKVKYYKGLGSSMESDAKEALKDIDSKIIEFIRDDECDNNVKLAFESSQSDQRKDWLMHKYDPKSSMDRTQKKMPVSTFINNELIHFSIYDCERSIPVIMDGFKPSQRKIMYVALEYACKSEMKVGQLGPKVSEKTDYHHGETSLMGAIIGMAQDFVGSNNINLLLPNGAFGSRLSGGADAASPRYIFTQVNPIANAIFDKRDNSLLEHSVSDGITIEPKCFYPIIPMILVNGALGIATGYSTKVLSYNPVEIINYLTTKLQGKTPKKTLMPWYRGFKGEITKVKSGTYNAYGVWKFIDGARSLHITELPVGVWTDDYKSFIDKIILENGPIAAADYRNDSTNVDITLQFTPGAYEEYKNMDPELMTKKLKLKSTMTTTNMVLFNSKGMITKYASIYGILTEFYEVRLQMYDRRRDAMIQQLQYEMLILSNKAKFIRSVKKGDIDPKHMTEQSLLTAMETGFDKDPRSTVKSGLGVYNYLIDMGYRSFTEENAKKMDALVEAKRKEIDEISNTTAAEMWNADLIALKSMIQ